jgi:hypothetical protein
MKQRIYKFKSINTFDDFLNYIYFIYTIKNKLNNLDIPEYEYN